MNRPAERTERSTSVDELLDRAVAAINGGDRATASALAGQVLAVDGDNADAGDLLADPGSEGEMRRLTILFADLVDSTALSTRVEPETYRMLVGGSTGARSRRCRGLCGLSGSLPRHSENAWL